MAPNAWIVLLILTVVAATLIGTAGSRPADAVSTSLALVNVRAMTVDPASGRVFVTGDDSLFAFDADGSLLTTVTGLTRAGGITIAGASLWVAETSTNTFAELDLATLAVKRRVAAGGQISGTSLAVSGTALWFVTGTLLRRLDLVTGAMVGYGKVGTAFEWIDPAGTTLLGTDGSSTVTRFDTATRPVTVRGTWAAPSAVSRVVVDRVHGTFTAGTDEIGVETMAPNGMRHPFSPSGAGPAGGGLFAGTASYQTVVADGVGAPRISASARLVGFAVFPGLAISPDGRRAYAVTQPTLASPTRTKALEVVDLTPHADALRPAAVTTTAPATVDVTGRNLGVTSATVGGRAVAFDVVSPSEVKLSIPVGLAPGSSPVSLTTPVGTTTTTLAVSPGAGSTLSGLVRGPSGPLAGVQVTLNGPELGVARTATSGADGSYTLGGLPFGTTHVLRAHDPLDRVGDFTTEHLSLDGTTNRTYDEYLDGNERHSFGPPTTTTTLPVAGTPRAMVVDPITDRSFVAVGDEVDAFASDGRLLGRLQDLYGIGDLALQGTQLFATITGVGRIVRIDPATLTVSGSWPVGAALPLGRPGGLAVTAGRAWFVTWASGGYRLTSLDLVTGAITVTPGTWTSPWVHPLDGSPGRFLLTDVALDPSPESLVDGATPTALVLSTASLPATAYGSAGSSARGVVVTPVGTELQLPNLAPTGRTYGSNTSPRPVAVSDARGGIAVIGGDVVQLGRSDPLTTIAQLATATAVGLGAGADHVSAIVGDTLAVTDLRPELEQPGYFDGFTDQASFSVWGSGLARAVAATVDGAPATLSTVTSGHVVVNAPGLAVGRHTVSVTTPWGTSNTLVFRVAVRLPPVVTDATPTSVTTAGGDVNYHNLGDITLRGTGLLGTTSVRFDGVPAANFSVWSDTQVVAQAPVHVAGTGTITVTTPAGTATAPTPITWVAPTPYVGTVSPSTASTRSPTPITIRGAGFVFASAVAIDGVPLSAFTVVDDSTITAIAPARAAGSATVSVTTAGGTGTGPIQGTFAYAPPRPVVTSISPASGLVTGGGTTTITGTAFTGALEVRFGSTSAPAFTVIDDTTIVATVPPGIAGTTSVTVRAEGGWSVPDSNARYTYVPLPTGRIVGQVRSTWNYLGGKLVLVTAPDTPTVKTWAVTAGDGTFVVPNLLLGDYKVLVIDPDQLRGMSRFYPPAYFRPASAAPDDFAAASTFTVAADHDTSLGLLTVQPYAPGSVSVTVSDGSTPLRNMAVVVSAAAGVGAFALTDSSGHATVTGLDNGTYAVAVIDPAQLFGATSFFLPRLVPESPVPVPTAASVTLAPLALTHN